MCGTATGEAFGREDKLHQTRILIFREHPCNLQVRAIALSKSVTEACGKLFALGNFQELKGCDFHYTCLQYHQRPNYERQMKRQEW
jgi:hypothetical protein